MSNRRSATVYLNEAEVEYIDQFGNRSGAIRILIRQAAPDLDPTEIDIRDNPDQGHVTRDEPSLAQLVQRGDIEEIDAVQPSDSPAP